MMVWVREGFSLTTMYSDVAKIHGRPEHRTSKQTQIKSTKQRMAISSRLILSASCLSLSSLKWSGALHAHAGRCQQSPLQQFAKASRGQFKHARMDGTRKRSWNRCDCGASDWGRPERKWKWREGGRGDRATAPTGGSVRSSVRPGLYPAAHSPTAGYPHPGQSLEVQTV